MTDLNQKLGIEIKIPDPLKRNTQTRQRFHGSRNQSNRISNRHITARDVYSKRKKKVRPITRNYFSQKKRW